MATAGSLGYNIEAEVVEKVIEHANELLDSPEIVTARQVNAAEVIDRAWQLGAVLPHPAHTLRIPDTFEPPEVPEDPDEPDDEPVEPYLAQPSHTLPLELPRDTPRTP